MPSFLFLSYQTEYVHERYVPVTTNSAGPLDARLSRSFSDPVGGRRCGFLVLVCDSNPTQTLGALRVNASSDRRS